MFQLRSITSVCHVHVSISIIYNEKSLKITNGYSEDVNRRTDNAMVTNKTGQKDKQRSKKTLHRKIKIEQHNLHFSSDCQGLYLNKNVTCFLTSSIVSDCIWYSSYEMV